LTILFWAASGLILTAPAAAGQPCSIDALAWMAGSWSLEEDSRVSEETWMTPRNGTMVGMNRETRPGRPAFFEFLRIEAQDSVISYIASPRGAEPTEFRLIARDADSVVFFNPDHDFPRRIIYQRISTDTLGARIEGVENGKPRQAAWRWTRAVSPNDAYDVHKQGMRRDR